MSCWLLITATGSSLPVQGEGHASTSTRKQCNMSCAQGTYEVDGRHERAGSADEAWGAGGEARGAGAAVCNAADQA